MPDRTKIRNWSYAIFELAVELDKVDSFLKSLEKLKLIFEEYPNVLEFLKNNFIKPSKKIKFIDAVLKNELDDLILNALKLIAEREIFSLITYILDNVIKKLWESLNIKKGIIYSIDEIDKATIDTLEYKISKKINKQIKLENKIDPSLIAGIRIEVANNVFDCSLKGKVRDMKNIILENRK